jgi:Flp pilus assembly protein TadD
MNAIVKVMKASLVLAGLVFTGTLFAAGSEVAPTEARRLPELVAGKAAIEAKDWQKAIDDLSRAAAKEPANADIQNFLGYANRKSGNLEAAFKHYDEALKLDPKHRGAHEYIGEAYLMQGNLAKAEEHLAALDKLCLFSCEEYRDLKKSIADYKAKK